MSGVEPSDLSRSQQAILATLARLPRDREKNRVFFEKVLFLLSKSIPGELPDLEESFEPYKFGPYSEFVDEQLLQLEDLGLMKQLDLGTAGKRIASHLSEDRGFAPVERALSSILEALRGFTVDDLLYLVYRLYPDFTTESEIRERIGSKILEHYSIDLDAARRGESVTVTSDKGTALNVRRQDGRLLLTPLT